MLSALFWVYTPLNFRVRTGRQQCEWLWRWRKHCNTLPVDRSLHRLIQRKLSSINSCTVSPSFVNPWWSGRIRHAIQHIVTHCNTLQHTATRCNTLQHTATHCNTLQLTATHCNTLQHTAIHCNTLQHSATLCNTLQHTATHCNTASCDTGTQGMPHIWRSHAPWRTRQTHKNPPAKTSGGTWLI